VSVIYKVPPIVNYYNIGEILQSADLCLLRLARATEPTRYRRPPCAWTVALEGPSHRPAFGSPFSSWNPASAG